MSWGWLEVPGGSPSLCVTHKATLVRRGLGTSLAPAGLRVQSGVLPQQRWSNRHRAQPRAMAIFTFPETASCSSNLPQLGSLPCQEGRSDGSGCRAVGSAGAAWAALAPWP